MNPDLPLRITLERPPKGVAFSLQRGKEGQEPPSQTSDDKIVFDFTMRVAGDRNGPPNFRGPYLQGSTANRFIYVRSGTLAGQEDSPWTRRVKVFLAGITWGQIDQVLSGTDTVLEARIAGASRDGGPATATVPLLGGGWKVAPQG
jgi:hypothetical protein